MEQNELTAEAVEASGFVLLDKPAGMTSFQLLSPLKKVFHTKRVGHAGTLDQEATGLMVAAVGKCTRLLERIESQTKLYSFRLHLGKETDTLELSGNMVTEDPGAVRTRSDLQAVLAPFVGLIDQMPPKYSAIKIEGRRASDLARDGEEVELKPRRIEIIRLEITSPESNQPVDSFDLICHCSKGTYIRSLGRDLAKAMETVGAVSNIRRLAIGNLLVEQGQSIESPDSLRLILPEEILPWPHFEVTDVELAALRQGKKLHMGPERSNRPEEVFRRSTQAFATSNGRAVTSCFYESETLLPELQLY